MTLRNKATSIRLADFSSAPDARVPHVVVRVLSSASSDGSALAPLMPVIRQELHLTKAQIGNSDHRFGR